MMTFHKTELQKRRNVEIEIAKQMLCQFILWSICPIDLAVQSWIDDQITICYECMTNLSFVIYHHCNLMTFLDIFLAG